MPAFGVGGDYVADNTYLNEALKQIDHLSNDDVEMKAPLSELATYLVLDTNILLHHFETLAQFVDDVERQALPVIVILPGAVIYELDGQKNRDGLAWFARRATAWLLEKIKERNSVKGQAQDETCKSTGNWKIKERNAISNSEMFNDDLILDCALYFRRERTTMLCSADKNLCIAAHAHGIDAITPSRYESSYEFAYQMFGSKVDLSLFEQHRKSYKNIGTPISSEDDDSMAVDEEGPVNSTDDWRSGLPVNVLHEGVADHFSRLLVDLVGRVGGDEVRQRSTPDEERNMSVHAPRRRPYTEWGIGECVEYLVRRAPVAIRLANPRPERFLLRPRTKGVRGSRPGLEWTWRDWEVGLENLRLISVGWGDVSIRESLKALEPHIESVFARPLRAT